MWLCWELSTGGLSGLDDGGLPTSYRGVQIHLPQQLLQPVSFPSLSGSSFLWRHQGPGQLFVPREAVCPHQAWGCSWSVTREGHPSVPNKPMTGPPGPAPPGLVLPTGVYKSQTASSRRATPSREQVGACSSNMVWPVTLSSENTEKLSLSSIFFYWNIFDMYRVSDIQHLSSFWYIHDSASASHLPGEEGSNSFCQTVLSRDHGEQPRAKEPGRTPGPTRRPGYHSFSSN